MKKIIILLLFLLSNEVYANDNLISSLQEGKKIIFIRHALAPGNGDPENFILEDCSTQRNLNERGREQSKNIGNFFRNKNISIDKVLSSEWCRCKDTARLAFDNFETFDALNSFYDERFAMNRSYQLKNLKVFINKWNSDSNLIIVTHYVVISALLNRGTSSGEMIVTDKKLNIIGNININ